MKTFMLVAMLMGLLVTMWLVARSVKEQAVSGPGATVARPIQRAQEVRSTVEAGDKLKEKKLEDAAGN